MEATLRWLTSLLAIFCISTTLANATEAITYQYNGLGRLVAVQSSGTANDGQNITTTFEAAGTAYGTSAIVGIYADEAAIGALLSDSSAPPNSGWTSIAVPGVDAFNRSTAAYSTSGATAALSWPSRGAVTSGTVVIQ